MGIFSRDEGDRAGAASQPEDTSGSGPVTLEDRTEPGGQGSPDTNQAKAEPMAPTPDHPEPLEVPDLASMNVGSADPQAPRHPDALRSGLSATGAYACEPPGTGPTRLSADGSTPDTGPSADDTTTGTTTGTGQSPDPEQPLQTTTGTAHRAPGLQGSTPDGEVVDTDVQGGAARLGPRALDSRRGESPGQGDDHDVPSSGTAPAPGTSEEHRIVTGVRLPEADQA